MSVISKILNHELLIKKPIVLVDVGASGNIHHKWKGFTHRSVCLAFDPDDREFNITNKENSKYHKLVVFNSILSDLSDDKVDFYLTKSPYCSSALEPDSERLKVWSFHNKFDVEKKIKLNNTTLQQALNSVGLDYVDWFKTDSQGIDLRIFKTLTQNIQDNVIVAEFEPGIIHSYKNEDKFYSILEYMSNKNFWLADLNIKGFERISAEGLNSFFKNSNLRKLLHFSIRQSPGWAEATYMNDFTQIKSAREYLIGYLFAIQLKQFGFALDLAMQGKKLFTNQNYASLISPNNLFDEMIGYAKRRIITKFVTFQFAPAIITKIKKLFIRQ